MRRTISILLATALVLTGLSWFKSEWVGGGGLFFPSSGPDFWSHGMPWWYMSCYLDGSCTFYFRYFLYDYLFWLVIISLAAFLIWSVMRLVSSIFHRSRD
jgi:hypothetical protein